MIINLNESYRLHGTPMNIVPEKKMIVDKGENKGNEYWSAIGYYPNLEWALHGMFKRHVETTEAEGIQSIINEIKLSTQAILQQINIVKEKQDNE